MAECGGGELLAEQDSEPRRLTAQEIRDWARLAVLLTEMQPLDAVRALLAEKEQAQALRHSPEPEEPRVADPKWKRMRAHEAD